MKDILHRRKTASLFVVDAGVTVGRSASTRNPSHKQRHEVANCTTLIQSRRESQHNKAGAYNNRGNAYNEKGDTDRAIADFNDAIRLDPQNTNAYINRGYLYYRKGDIDRAMRSHATAIVVARLANCRWPSLRRTSACFPNRS
jgi:tetratricopeptide (TPR) repeat protein